MKHTLQAILRMLRTTPRDARRRAAHCSSGPFTTVRPETLETRLMLAGDVTAQLVGRTVLVNGDAADNSVELLVENGNIVARGADGTTVNGLQTDVVIGASASARHLVVRLGNGSDTVSIDGLTLAGNARIHAGNGSDTITVTGSAVGGDLSIYSGAGDDSVSLQDSTIGRTLRVFAGAGNDLVAARNVSTGRDAAIVSFRGSNDVVFQDSVVGRDLRVLTGRGHDDIVLKDTVVQDDLTIRTHRGADGVLLDSATVGDKTVITTGRGVDTISFDGTTRFFDRTRVHAGRATDFFQVAPTVVFDGLKTRSVASMTADDAFITERLTTGPNSALVRADAAAGIVVQQTLTLDVSVPTVSEGAGDGAALLTITRGGDTSAPLDVALATSDAGRLIPEQATVTIPAGEASVTVALNPQDNFVSGDTAEITIVASADGFADSTTVIEVTDDDTSAIQVAIAEPQVEEDSGNQLTVGAANTFSITVSHNGDSTVEQTLTLTASPAGHVTVPGTVTIPAGQSAVTITGETIPDSVTEPDTTVSITATGPGFAAGTDTIVVIDNDSSRLTLSFDADEIAETGTDATRTLTVTRNTDTTGPLSVVLTSHDPQSVTFGGAATTTVEIPAGADSTTVTVNGVEESLDDGDVSVRITASAAGHNDGFVFITATDDDQPTLTMSVTSGATVQEDAGQDSVTVRIARNTDTTDALSVTLAVSDTSRLTGPASVDIPAGADHVDVSFTPVDDNIVNQPASQVVSLTATADGFVSAGTQVTVTNDDVATISLSPTAFSVQEDGGTASMTLSRTSSADTVTVNLTYSNPSLITGPATVTFQPGENLATLPLTIIDNGSFLSNPDVTVTAESDGHPTVFATVSVVNDDLLTLTTDTSMNTVIESVGTVVTSADSFVIKGTTAPGATVTADNDGNGSFNDATATADSNGDFTISVPLTHDDMNHGANPLQLRVTPPSGEDVSTVSTVINVHRSVGTVVRFSSNQDFDNDGQSDFFDIEMLDADAPVTVSNFLSYTTPDATGTERFDNLIVQRSVPDFVIQAGRYNVSGQQVTELDRDADNDGSPDTIPNEFNPKNSNLRGTLSMALPANSPDGGSSEWFINVVDNTFLDDPSRLHTVFGRVIGSGMNVVDAVNRLPVFDLNAALGQTALNEVPLLSSPFTQLTGTVSLTENSNVITGDETQFTTEVSANDIVRIGGSLVRVTAVNSDTEMTVEVQASGNATGLVIERFTPPQETDYVVFTDIGKILDAI